MENSFKPIPAFLQSPGGPAFLVSYIWGRSGIILAHGLFDFALDDELYNIQAVACHLFDPFELVLLKGGKHPISQIVVRIGALADARLDAGEVL